VCQIIGMQRSIRCFFATFAVALAASGAASAQMQGNAEWDPTARQFGGGQGGTAAPAATRNATLETLNKILSTSQLPPLDRSVYLSVRAFQLSRLGREADSQKDIVEMGKVLPNGWQVVLSGTQPELAGGGDRATALRILGYGLQRKPGDPWLTIAQAQVHMQIADFPRALSMLDSAVAASAGPGDRRTALYYRAQANFNLGNFQQAADDFDGTLAGRTTVKQRLGPLLWRYAAQVHTRQDARAMLNKEIGNENLYEWPGPIAKFLLGKLPAGELEVAAESDESAKRDNGKCPAAFFVGIDAVRRGDKQRAREQLQLAQARCPTSSELNWAASSELKRL
jgi:tetratricopeptide (TPR) repeat protein